MKLIPVKNSSLAKCAIYLFLIYATALDASESSTEITLEEYAKTPFGNVLFLRHAYAPGFDANGKPDKFEIDSCSTQRNLDSTGRTQAMDIGKQFVALGIGFKKIYSSQWCRCLETAQLLNLGKVIPEPALNSGFRGIFKKEISLPKLKKILVSLRNEEKLILMVTHFGIIKAMTGSFVKSGGAVAYDTKTKESRIITFE